MVLILWSFSSSPSLYFCHSVMPLFLSLYITLPFLSLSITLLQYTASPVRFFTPFFFLLLCLVLGVWVVRKHGKAEGNIYFLILVWSLNIYMILSFFFLLGAWCLDDEKMWETKGKLAFSFSLICLVSKKLEATESRPNRTDWNPVSSVLVLLPYGSLSVPNLVKSKISIWWKNRTSNRLKPTDYIPRCYIN